VPEFGGVEVDPGAVLVEPAVGEFGVAAVVGFVPEFGGMVPGVWTHPFMGGTGAG
jgi:hypothetical protein